MNELTRRVGDRWEAGLLWKVNGGNMRLPDNYSVAFNRLIGVERRLERDPLLKVEYQEKIDHYSRMGYARIPSEEERNVKTGRQWLQPHFPTFHPNKLGKMRIVFDASSKCDGLSLGSFLLTGPDLLVSLSGVLLKFRRKAIAFTGDITEVFHQVKIRQDDCAAPGGWLQVAAQNMRTASLIVGIDLVPIPPIPQVMTLEADITTEECRNLLFSTLNGWKADILLNDGAPNVGQNWVQDAYGQAELTLSALKLATEFLVKGGWFVTKIFLSKENNSLKFVAEKMFKRVIVSNPKVSRNESAEIFWVCKHYLAPDKIDPKFLDPQYVFRDVVQEGSKNKVSDLLRPVSREKPKAEGYDDLLVYKKVPISEFIYGDNYTEILYNAYEITLDDETIANHLSTTAEIKENLKDIKVLGPADIKRLLKWRRALREELVKKEPGREAEEKLEEEDVDALLAKELEEVTGNIRKEKKRKQKKLQKRQTQMLKSEAETDLLAEDYDLFTISKIKTKKALETIGADQEPPELEPEPEEEEAELNKKKLNDMVDDGDALDSASEEEDDAEEDEEENPLVMKFEQSMDSRCKEYFDRPMFKEADEDFTELEIDLMNKALQQNVQGKDKTKKEQRKSTVEAPKKKGKAGKRNLKRMQEKAAKKTEAKLDLKAENGFRPEIGGKYVQDWRENVFLAVSWILVIIPRITAQPSVTLPDTGTVITGTQHTVSGKSLDVYLSIPYAQAPTGERRFKDPEPITNLPPQINATQFPPSCYQKGFRPEIHVNKEMSEDCLFLNLWAPSNRSNMAVLIHIYGGGFEIGSSDYYEHNPQYLSARTNMVVVTFNYRLSSLGFLDLNREGFYGNMGLKDQILAFKWVNKYIRIFGGNPNKVTLYGLSSGSMSIAFHLSIAENKNLFKRAFLQSGVSNNPFFHFSKTRIQKGIDLYYQVLNCNPNSSEVLQCLQSKTPEEILKAEEETTKIMSYTAFWPKLNGKLLPFTSILDFTKKNIILKKDIIIGLTTNEVSLESMRLPQYFASINATKQDAINYIEYISGQSDSKEFTQIANTYLKNVRDYDYEKYVRVFKEFLEDATVRCPVFYFSNIMASKNNRVFFYYFTHQTEYNVKNDSTRPIGAVHGEDQQYVLGLPLRGYLSYTPKEIKFSNRMMDYVGNFAKKGSPRRFIWPRYRQGASTPPYKTDRRPHLLAELNANYYKLIALPKRRRCTILWRPFFYPSSF
ncbi:FTSJ3 [Cordylochernes scorpioides]|uniref:acetylcholinesterase n=1 Tax=Cordylochernes scorpioides TaxID=51811 RepID=A0ABY6LB26_9ARAC|nr:FTSJ3 [Cordylochernes scorpioides]